DRVPPAGVEVEGPRELVVGGAADRQGQGVLQAEQAPYDDRPVRPRAGAGHDQAVAAGFDRPPVATVSGDPVLHVVGVALVLAGLDVAHGALATRIWRSPLPAHRPVAGPSDLDKGEASSNREPPGGPDVRSH